MTEKHLWIHFSETGDELFTPGRICDLLRTGSPLDPAVLAERFRGYDRLIITAVNKEIGEALLVKDHINLSGRNPLRGKNHDDLGPRFPDMSRVYDPHPLLADVIGPYRECILTAGREDAAEIRSDLPVFQAIIAGHQKIRLEAWILTGDPAKIFNKINEEEG